MLLARMIAFPNQGFMRSLPSSHSQKGATSAAYASLLNSGQAMTASMKGLGGR
jgi:hypothetical protein